MKFARSIQNRIIANYIVGRLTIIIMRENKNPIFMSGQTDNQTAIDIKGSANKMLVG